MKNRILFCIATCIAPLTCIDAMQEPRVKNAASQTEVVHRPLNIHEIANQNDYPINVMLATRQSIVEQPDLFEMAWVENLNDLAYVTIPARSAHHFERPFLANPHKKGNRLMVLWNDDFVSLTDENFLSAPNGAGLTILEKNLKLRTVAHVFNESTALSCVDQEICAPSEENGTVSLTLNNMRPACRDVYIFIYFQNRCKGAIVHFAGDSSMKIDVPMSFMRDPYAMITIVTDRYVSSFAPSLLASNHSITITYRGNVKYPKNAAVAQKMTADTETLNSPEKSASMNFDEIPKD